MFGEAEEHLQGVLCEDFTERPEVCTWTRGREGLTTSSGLDRGQKVTGMGDRRQQKGVKRSVERRE